MTEPAPLPFDVAQAAIVGRRASQQDFLVAAAVEAGRAALLVLGDGMGGHEHGELASRLAVGGFLAAATEADAKGADRGEVLRIGLEAADACLNAAKSGAAAGSRMGTTLVGAIVDARGIDWISVGDSPLWRYRDGRLDRLNEDHSLRALRRAGATVSGNILRSAVDGGPIALVDQGRVAFDPGPATTVLLASDGLLTLDEAEIAAILARDEEASARATTEALVAAVEAHGDPRQDNCTLFVARPPPKRPFGWSPSHWMGPRHA